MVDPFFTAGITIATQEGSDEPTKPATKFSLLVLAASLWLIAIVLLSMIFLQ